MPIFISLALVNANMAHGGPTAGWTGGLDPATIGNVLARVGLAVLALTVPVVAGAGAGLFAAVGSPTVGVARAVAAMDGPLLDGFGLPWLFHVAALSGLCGCWLLGAGLLLTGLFD